MENLILYCSVFTVILGLSSEDYWLLCSPLPVHQPAHCQGEPPLHTLAIITVSMSFSSLFLFLSPHTHGLGKHLLKILPLGVLQSVPTLPFNKWPSNSPTQDTGEGYTSPSHLFLCFLPSLCDQPLALALSGWLDRLSQDDDDERGHTRVPKSPVALSLTHSYWVSFAN